MSFCALNYFAGNAVEVLAEGSGEKGNNNNKYLRLYLQLFNENPRDMSIF